METKSKLSFKKTALFVVSISTFGAIALLWCFFIYLAWLLVNIESTWINLVFCFTVILIIVVSITWYMKNYYPYGYTDEVRTKTLRGDIQEVLANLKSK